MKVMFTQLFYAVRPGWARLVEMSFQDRTTNGTRRGRRSPAISCFWVVVIVAASAVGCVSTDPLEPPGVHLVDLDFVDATIFESTLDVAVRISNDNPESLILDGAVIKLELAGRSFGKGAIAERVEIPRFGSVVQRLEMHLNHIAVATKIKGIIDSKVVDYGITGKVYVLTSSGSVRRLPIERRGTIDLRGGGPLEFQDDPPPPDGTD